MAKELLTLIPRWITSSVRKGFVERVENLPVFVEEEIKLNNEKKEYVELRIDGPFINPIGSRNEYQARIEVNALITCSYDETDSLRLIKIGGIVIAALSKDFCIYKYGDEDTDDRSYFETMQVIADDQIELSNFGQIDPTNKVYQASVEAHYTMRFKNGTV
jgi:hypothetical protein